MSDQTDPQFTPFVRAVLDSVSEGIVVFDTRGQLAYANRAGQAALAEAGADGDAASTILPRLARLGSRIAPIWVNGAKVGEAVYLPRAANGGPSTLAERERYAIIETLDETDWKLTESAKKLGISRTTLWRRLRAYGLHRDNRARWSRSS
ncbi:MAG: helix-turn-helix domain-containing protein [Gemmatimonadales bacterium]|jgi:transcriptional regulator of acetoin/glycerol metabolism